MSFVIILRGPAGAGKTSVSKRLSEVLKAHHISIDKIKKEKGLKHSEEEKLQANKYVIEEARKMLAKGKIVIIDEVFYYESQIKEILDNVSSESYIFSLHAPLDVCLRRNGERRKNNLRKMKDEDVKEVYELVSKFDSGIKINTDCKPVDETVSEILCHINTQQS